MKFLHADAPVKGKHRAASKALSVDGQEGETKESRDPEEQRDEEEEHVEVLAAPARIGRRAASAAKSNLKEPSLSKKMRNPGSSSKTSLEEQSENAEKDADAKGECQSVGAYNLKQVLLFVAFSP